MPLYERLPRGPHWLTREQVMRNQRRRIHGALIESVARHGYSETFVRHIIGYSGVSKRVFYDLYRTKEDCFLATFDVIAARIVLLIARACKPVGDPEKRRRLAMRVLAEEVAARPKSMRLLLVDALTASPSATRRLGWLLRAAEWHLANPAAPWIVGGLYRVLFSCLRAYRVDGTLHGLMHGWAQLLSRNEIYKLRPGQGRAPPWPQTPQLRLTAASDRERLEQTAINMVLRGQQLTPLAIVRHAGVSLDAYLSNFTSVDECIQAALDTQGQQLLETIADPALVSDAWRTEVQRAIGRATAYLATHPAYTTMLATRVYEIGLAERTLLLGDEIAILLTEGAPNHQPKLTTEFISGAFAHTIRTEVEARRGHRLPEFDTALSRMTLASYM